VDKNLEKGGSKMSMFCYQCQEASQGIGCTVRGVCGKTDDVANLQDLLIFTLKGISFLNLKARETGVNKEKTDRFLFEGLFSTITNVNFDRNFFINKIKEAVALREEIKEDLKKAGIEVDESCEAIHWVYDTDEDIEAIAAEVGVLSTKDEDIRSLRELITYGVKGMAAYAYHAYQLGYKDDNIFRFMEKALAKVLDVEEVPKSDKLLKLEVKIGDEKRTILAGIKQYYSKDELVGKKILVVYNLKPRKMMGFESQGMVLALSDGDNFSLIIPDKDVKDGTFAR